MITYQQPSEGMNPDKVVIMATAALDNFARHMAQLRKAQKLSQPKLAEKVGTVANVIGRYERGEATPSIETAKKIADALGTTLDFMMNDSPNADPAKEREFGDRCRVAAGLPEDDQRKLLDLMDIVIRDARARSAYG